MSDIAATWSKTLEILAPDVPAHGFEAWLKPTQPVALHDDVVILAVPNQFAKTYIEDRMAPRIRSIMSFLLQRDVTIQLLVPPEADVEPDEPQPVAPYAPPTAEQQFYQPLNPKYVFDTFVVGSGNRLAHAASLAVAEAPARAYNPLFIYGGVGLGKTHLMHAIAQHILRKNPSARVVYVSSETFTNELVNAIRDRRQLEFRNRYRNVDVLLIDDVQFIGGKETTQEEFFHTFNTLHESHRQVVLSSDRPPKEIPTLEERLRSRFEWGLISDIQPPDLETRIAILHKKAQADGLTIPQDVLLFIAERIQTNIRELEGALIRLVAYTSIHRLDITLDVARLALQDTIPKPEPKPITVRLIQEVVASHYNLSLSDFQARRRTQAIAFPRQVAMYLARELTETSLSRIGEEFGGRDHSTVLHACEKIAHDLESNPELAAVVASLKRKIQQAG